MSKEIRRLLKRAGTSLVALAMALGLCPFQAFASQPVQGGGDDEASIANSVPALIEQAEANGECASGEALVVYHASGAPKGSTGELAIQSDENPLESAGFSLDGTWDLSEADSSDGAAAAAADGALSVQSEDGSTIASGSDVRVSLVKSDTASTADLVVQLEALDFVECAGPNYYYEPLSLTDDVYSDLQYSLADTAGVDYQAALDAEANAEAGSIGSNVIAIIDTGVDYNNPDLKDKMWTDSGDLGLGQAGSHGYNAITGEYDPMCLPSSGHGTHCAGVAAAETGNGIGIAGAAGNGTHTQIMGVRIEGDDGIMRTHAIVAGYEYVVKAKLAGVNIVAANNSWGAGGTSGSEYDPVLDYVVNQAGKAGVLSCFAAGNAGVDNGLFYDTVGITSPYSIVVAASNRLGKLASYSCFNATKTDVAAPGSAIVSTLPVANTDDFSALLSRESGAYDAVTNPYGKSDKLLYYTDIASLSSTEGSNFKVVLIDKSGNSLPAEAQAALSWSVADESGTPWTFQGQKALKVSVDYDALAKAGDYTALNTFASVEWTMSNPFKNSTGLTAADYAIDITGMMIADSNMPAMTVIPTVLGKDAQGADATLTKLRTLYKHYFSSDYDQHAKVTFDYIDSSSDTLVVKLPMRLFSDSDAYTSSGTQSCLVSAFGIGKNTDSDSACVPFGTMSGTSMATPMITGCIAELAALYPTYSPLQLRGLICGGTTELSEDEQGKIASGGRFTFENALDPDKVNANTWSITTERNIVTVHGYALEGAVLLVDGQTVTPFSQTDGTISFTADTALFDGNAHEFDVTDGTTGRTYKASYAVPDSVGDSLEYICDMPVDDDGADDSLVATPDQLLLADGHGEYLYACDPTSSTPAWTKLAAPGVPWKEGSATGSFRSAVKYTYLNGKVYAVVTDTGSNNGYAIATVYYAVYDMSNNTWSSYTQLDSSGNYASRNVYDLSASVIGGKVCFTAALTYVYSSTSSVSYTAMYTQNDDGTFARSEIYSPEDSTQPYALLPCCGSLYGLFSRVATYNPKMILAPHLITCKGMQYDEEAEGYILVDAGAISGFDATTSIATAFSLQKGAQAAVGNGIVVADVADFGSGDLDLVTVPDCTVESLGWYGVASASGYAVGSMAMYGSKLYLDAVDHASGTPSNALYTLPEEQNAKLASRNVAASTTANKGGTATVSDAMGNSGASVSVIAGDTVTWAASAKPGYTFLGWYGEDGSLVSRDASYSAYVEDDLALSARFTSGSRVIRLWGASALDTATAIVGEGGFAKGGTVVLATLGNFPDALTAAGIAGLADAPVLLTDSSELSAQTALQLTVLRPMTVIVCGGTVAISDDVATAAKAAAGAFRLYRCAGATRSGTACEVYRNAHAYAGGSFGTTAFIATGSGFADALSIAPYCYAEGCPIFLTEDADTISDETIQTMLDGGIKDFYVLGGTAVVSDKAVKTLTDNGFTMKERLAGSNRYETSNAIAKFEVGNGMKADNLGVATGLNYKDALTGAALCGKNGSVLVLADDSDHAAIDGIVAGNKAGIATAYVFGGTSAVSADTMAYLEKTIS